MEFWGVELKGDKPVKVQPGMDEVIHLSQATLAELKKGSDNVMLYAKVGEQKLVIGVLNSENAPQLSFDLVFEKEFELSHNWKNGNVHLAGYKSLVPDDDSEEISDFDEDEALPVEEAKPNGVAAAKAKPSAPVAKADVKVEEESDDSDEDDSDEDDEDESGEEDESSEEADSDEEMADGDDSDEDESDDEEDEETPVKSASAKKRPAPASKTPEAKKVKVITPQKTDGKKSNGGHTDTPHPAKNAKTPKSGGSGKKSFNNSPGQKKGKHSGKK